MTSCSSFVLAAVFGRPGGAAEAARRPTDVELDSPDVPHETHVNCRFEPGEPAASWTGAYGTPIKAVTGDGALGSKGFLEVGPHVGKWVGARCSVRFVAREDTWVGFSARKPGGTSLDIQIYDSKRKKNVSKTFHLPANGSWGTFRMLVAFLGIDPGTPLAGVGFWHRRNDTRAAVSFAVGNVVIGTGNRVAPPLAVAKPTAVLREEGVPLSWAPPRASAGIATFRVYRGLHPAFANGARHLFLETPNPSCDATRLPTPTTTFASIIKALTAIERFLDFSTKVFAVNLRVSGSGPRCASKRCSLFSPVNGSHSPKRRGS